MKIITKITLLFILLGMFGLQEGSTQTHKLKATTKKAEVVSTMTVKNIANAKYGENYILVLFVGWDKVYKLSVKADPKYARALKESMDQHKPVYIYRANDQSDIIQKVVVAGTSGEKKKKK